MGDHYWIPIVRWVKQPAIHFVVLGAALFALKLALQGLPVAVPRASRLPIVISATQVSQLLADFSRRTGLQPSADDEAALVDRWVDDEVLYRRAVELGFDRSNRSVRYRLIQKMRFLNGGDGGNPDALYRDALDLGMARDDAVVHRLLVETMRLLISTPAAPVSEEAVHAYFLHHQEQYREPARVTFTQVFVSAQRGAAVAERGAARLWRQLQAEGTPPEQAVGRGDPFPLGQRVRASSQSDLAKCFGADFAARVMQLTPGAWSVPIQSSYGMHVVWLEAIEPAHVPPFEAVRRQVVEAFTVGQREQRLRRALRDLRQQYVVRVEPRRARGGA